MSGRGWVVVALLALAFWFLWRSWKNDLIGETFTPPELPNNWGATDDDKQWNTEADAIRHAALADVRGVAEKWGATVGTLLGLFSVVVFAKGPDTLTAIPGDDAYLVLALALLAILAAAGATYCAAMAAQGTPATLENLNGWTLKQLCKARLPTALKLLKASRTLTLAAVLLILGAVTVGWLAALDARGSSSGQKAIATRADGSIECGELKLSGQQLALDTGSGTPHVLSNVRQIVLVDDCPN
jgi:hypothetical protein